LEQLNQLKSGRYLGEVVNSEPIPLCIGVAGYPEKHVESPNMKADIAHLRRKIEAGAEYVVTQMFFDNADYIAFVERCRAAGISVPIVPGIKVLSRVEQLTSLPRTFRISIPSELADEVQARPQHASEIGVAWARRQCAQLLNSGVRCVHFFVMNDATSVLRVVRAL
jgi:methylenetetrahydrofolate reductase (NADPH)